MALTYGLEMATDRNGQDVVKMMCDVAGTGSDSMRPSGTGYHVALPNADLYVHPSSTLSVSVIQEAFGFTPKVYASFRVDKFASQQGLETVLNCSLELLKRLPDDMVLLSNGEAVVFVRRSGKLLLNDRCSLWHPSQPYLSRVAVEYEMASFEVL